VARFRRELAGRFTETTCDEIVDIAENLADLDKVARLTDLLATGPAR
jgi:hypothetical protein